MMTPLTGPTAAAGEGCNEADEDRGRRRACIEGGAGVGAAPGRLMTQPTERSMPAAMMTKVWPSPERTGMIATRMFGELRMVKWIPVVNGTATRKTGP